MNKRHFEIFKKVYELSSISKAAKELFLAQPAVSLAIKEIEEHYHITLFDRLNRKLYPTNHAHDLYAYTCKLLSLYQEMELELNDIEKSGTITIGSSITISNYVLPTLISLFKQHYPHIEFHMIINNSKIIEQLLLENKIDFALIETSPISSNIIKIPFMHDELVTIAPLNHPLTSKPQIDIKDLSIYPFLMREEDSSVHQLIKSIFNANMIDISPSMQSTSSQAIIQGVIHNLGIATMPYLLAKDSIKKHLVEVLNVPQLNVTRVYHIIYLNNKYISKTLNHLFDICQNTFLPPK